METIDKQLTIGGSEVYELLNEPTYGKGCRRALAYRKLGYEPDFPREPGSYAILERGIRMERIAAEIYEEKTGRKLVRRKTQTHKQFPWARVSTDRLIRRQNGMPTGDLEIKTRGEGPFYKILRDGPLKADMLQLEWSLWITGHRWGALAELGVFSELPMKIFEFEADHEMFVIFENEGRRFNEEVFVNRQLPAPPFADTDERCKTCSFRLQCRGEAVDPTAFEMHKKIEASKKHLVQIEDPDLVTTLNDVDLMEAEEEALKESIKVAKQTILDRLIGADGAVVKGFGTVYRLPVIAAHLDTKLLKDENREIYDRYYRKYDTGNYKLLRYPFVKEKEGEDA
jgi:hypothetical protein